MGMRYVTRLFKPAKKPNFKTVVLAVAEEVGAYAEPSKDGGDMRLLRIGERAGIYTADFPYVCGDHIFFRQLGIKLGGVWLEARIQEGSHWDYTLQYPGVVLDNFSTLPEYWSEDELIKLSTQGRPEILAKAWGVPIELIERYVRQWGMRTIDEDTYETVLEGKAYPTDRFEYGNYDQLFDLIEKLNYTNERKWFFDLRLPSWNFSAKAGIVEGPSVENR
jgi:hypothetical protein